MIEFISKHAENLFVLVFLLIVLVAGVFIYENTKLTVINQRLEHELSERRNELVDSQNQAWGYKWQLHQINRENGWSGDE